MLKKLLIFFPSDILSRISYFITWTLKMCIFRVVDINKKYILHTFLKYNKSTKRMHKNIEILNLSKI